MIKAIPYPMNHRYVILLTACIVISMSAKSQDYLLDSITFECGAVPVGTHITYDLTAEASAGTGDYTAYQLATNRHHVVGTRSNTAYLRGAINVKHFFNNNLAVSGAIDALASVHADHPAYLQQ